MNEAVAPKVLLNLQRFATLTSAIVISKLPQFLSLSIWRSLHAQPRGNQLSEGTHDGAEADGQRASPRGTAKATFVHGYFLGQAALRTSL